MSYSPRSPDQSLNSLVSLQAQKIEIMQKQISILSQSFLGVCASWYNSPDFFTEEAARILLDYLQPCRQISLEAEELFRAVYYTAGSAPGPRRRQSPVPPPPFDSAPPAFEAPAPGQANASASVLRQGDYWRATVQTPEAATSVSADRFRTLLADRLLGISVRRLDVFPAGARCLAICLYDSDDPSAKPAAACLKEVCDLINQISMTVAPTGDMLTASQSVQLSTWKFLGLAADLAQLYRETRGFTGVASAAAAAPGPPRDWRATLEKQLA